MYSAELSYKELAKEAKVLWSLMEVVWGHVIQENQLFKIELGTNVTGASCKLLLLLLALYSDQH